MPRPSEVRESETQAYTCDKCGGEMSGPLPKGLSGTFVHARCEGPDAEFDMYGVLNASFLG